VSVESLAIALNHSKAKGVARLVLIGMANHDGDGGIWPSVDRLRRYAGGVDRRTVQRAVEQLVALGEVARLVNEGGNRTTANDRRPNLYRFLLTCPPDCDRTTQHNTRRGRAIRWGVESADDELALHASEPVDNSGRAYDGAAPAPPRGAALVPPEPSKEVTTKESDSATDARARERCLDGSPHHAFSARVGACVYCGLRRPDHQTGRQRA
jgi:hypothetical protein